MNKSNIDKAIIQAIKVQNSKFVVTGFAKVKKRHKKNKK